MFGLGSGEILLILLIILLLFGGKRIPEIMRALGEGWREFRKAASEASQEIQSVVEAPVESPSPETTEAPEQKSKVSDS